MDTKKSIFTVKNDKGKTITYEIIFTFTSTDDKKTYWVYTDNTKERGSLKVYASIYDDHSKTLNPLTKDEEWHTVEALLSQLEGMAHNA